MDVNEKLTADAFYDKWYRIGLSTEPADCPTAEWGVRWLYDISGNLQPPIVWCQSPEAIDIQGNRRNDNSTIALGVPKINSGGYSVIERYAHGRFERLGNILENVALPVGLMLSNAFGWNTSLYMMSNPEPFTAGQHLAGNIGFLDYIATTNLHLQTLIGNPETLRGLIILAISSGWSYLGRRTCLISDRHSVLYLDDENRLHREDGMAVAYPDGFGVWAWHGTVVDEDTINRNFTTQQIDNQINIERRRVMMEIYGIETYLMDSNATLVHSDGFGELYRKEWRGGEPLTMVKVINSTPEHDGTYKDYFIRVPPNMETAEQAVAWTFNYEAGEYKPKEES